MLQDTKCADPSESEVRKERLRQAEEQGQLEESAIVIAQKSLIIENVRQCEESNDVSPERIPASQRLGAMEKLPSINREKESVFP